MNAEEYQPTLDVTELLRELKRLLLGQRQSDRLICRYLADLVDGIVEWPTLMLAYGTPLEFVRAKFGFSAKTARERIRIGRALRTLPVLDAALNTGQIAYSSTREVTRVATPETQGIWLEAAQKLSPRALERRVAAASGRTHAPRPPRPQAQPGTGTATNPASEPGHVNISLPSEVWALVLRAIHAVRVAGSSELDNWQALAEVARSAIAYTGGLSAERPVARDDRGTDGSPSAPHGGPRGSDAVGPLPSAIQEHRPTGDNTVPPVVHDGSPVTTAPHPVVPASSSSPNWAPAATDDPAELALQCTATTAIIPPTMHELVVPHGGERDAPWRGDGRQPAPAPIPHGGTGDAPWGGNGHQPAPAPMPHGGTGDAPSDGYGDRRTPVTAGPTMAACERGKLASAVGSHHSDVYDEPLSADARLLFDLIATGGDWNLVTLAVVTEMPDSRLAEAVVDLELSRLIQRDVMGFYEVRQKQAG